MTDNTPDPVVSVGEMLERFGAAMANVVNVLHAQGAFGWMFQGNLEQARSTLSLLSMDALQTVSVEGAALSSLADEVAAGKTSPGPS